jgi:hypothetical protein
VKTFVFALVHNCMVVWCVGIDYATPPLSLVDAKMIPAGDSAGEARSMAGWLLLIHQVKGRSNKLRDANWATQRSVGRDIVQSGLVGGAVEDAVRATVNGL